MGWPPIEIGISSLTATAGFVVTLWLGCYFATHTTRSRVAWLATLAILSLAGYFLHAVLCLHVPAVEAGFLWRRLLGWFAIPPFPLWLHLTTELLPARLTQRLRWAIVGAYVTGLVLAASWLFGAWTFSTTSLVPLELGLPVGIFGAVTTLVCLASLWYSQSRALESVLGHHLRLLWLATLLSAAGGVYWPLLAARLSLPWKPSWTLALGEAVLVSGLLVLAYAVARHNVFMAGRWILRDFVYHALAITVVTGLYLAAIVAMWRLALALNFNAIALILVVVAGLAIVTHLLADRVRGMWDAVFFRELRPLRVEMRALAQEIGRPVQLAPQMQQVVESLSRFTGCALVCLALNEGQELVIRAATAKERIGQTVLPERPSSPTGQFSESGEGFALREPLWVFDKETGYLLLGQKGVGEGYDRQERMWIAAMAAHLAALLEQAHLREEATQQLAAIAHEVGEIQSQEATLHQEMQRVLADGPACVNSHELSDALRCYGHPERLTELLNRPGSTLATLSSVVQAGTQRVQALQSALSSAVETLRPSEDLGLPSLETLQARAIHKKRRRHIPASIADYYTLRLIMAGYTYEAIAEEMDISPRQVRNYLGRALNRVVMCLEADSR